jgi:short-subunit dehydrogenase
MTPTALITGASAGIGLELAKRFAAGGYALALTARRGDELTRIADDLKAKYGVPVHVFPIDLSEVGGPAKLYEQVTAAGLTIDVLVNNAGFGTLGPFLDTPLEQELAMVRLNVSALVELTGRFVPAMRARGSGRVLNVASVAAFQPGPYMAIYYATKAFVLSFSEALWDELRKTGVTVTCLCPGPVRTEFAERAGMTETNLFTGRNVMSVEAVCDAGYRATLKGKRLVVPGFLNRVLIFLVRLAPRRMVLRIVRRFQMKRK